MNHYLHLLAIAGAMLLSYGMEGQTVGNLPLPANGTLPAHSQRERDCPPKDIRDLFRKKGKEKKERQSMLLVLPNLSSNPANGLLIGAAGTTGFYLGPRASTRVSSAGFSAAFTTKRQFLSILKSNVYTAEDRLFLTNINVDFGVGNKSRGFYFSGTETF